MQRGGTTPQIVLKVILNSSTLTAQRLLCYLRCGSILYLA